jgi:Cu+-exporting ATPase
MDSNRQGNELYQMEMEGPFDPLREGGFLSEVVATWPVEGDVHAGLVRVTPEQFPRLRELLHVQRLEPAEDGLFVDRLGHWYVVSGGEVTQSGWYGMVPREALQALQGNTGQVFATPSPASIQSEPAMTTPTTMPSESPAPIFAPSLTSASASGSRERDPVCGMELRPGLEEANTNYQGQTYHFCSVECRDLFLKDPSAYIGEARRAATA